MINLINYNYLYSKIYLGLLVLISIVKYNGVIINLK